MDRRQPTVIVVGSAADDSEGNVAGASWVTGPGRPAPTDRRSTERTGVISAAVPVKNISSQRLEHVAGDALDPHGNAEVSGQG